MADLSKFEKRIIVRMMCAGCSVKETVNYLERARAVSAVMTAYTKCGKELSVKHISRRKTKLFERDKRELTRILVRKRRHILSQISSEMNSISRIPVQQANLIYVQRKLILWSSCNSQAITNITSCF